MPMGVLYRTDKPTYEQLAHQQVVDATAKFGKGDLNKLMYSGLVWDVGADGTRHSPRAVRSIGFAKRALTEQNALADSRWRRHAALAAGRPIGSASRSARLTEQNALADSRYGGTRH